MNVERHMQLEMLTWPISFLAAAAAATTICSWRSCCVTWQLLDDATLLRKLHDAQHKLSAFTVCSVSLGHRCEARPAKHESDASQLPNSEAQDPDKIANSEHRTKRLIGRLACGPGCCCCCGGCCEATPAPTRTSSASSSYPTFCVPCAPEGQ